jgi:hypothetical protein
MGNMLRVAWVGNSHNINWQAGMTSTTLLLVPVANYTNHGLVGLCGYSLLFSTVSGDI